MGKKVLSIDIGPQRVRICEMDYKKRIPKIYHCIVFKTPKDSVEDGYIRDKEALAGAVRKELSDANIKTADVVFSIASSRIANREVIIPLVKDNKIQSVVEAGAQDYFPLDVSDYSFAYTVLERGKGKEDKKLKLLLLAAPNNLLKNYYTFAEFVGLHVEALDYAGNSFFQIAKRQVDAGVHIAVQINEQVTIINVIDNGTLALQRTVPYGSEQIVETVLENEVFGKATDQEAIDLLRQEHIINTQFDSEKEEGEAASAFSSSTEAYERVMREIHAKEEVTDTLRGLVSNVTRVLDYFNSKYPEKKIGYVYICGPGSEFRGMTHLFRNEIGLTTKRFERLFGINFSKDIDLTGMNELDLITSVGASIDPVQFVFKEALAKAAKKSDVIVIRLIFGLSILLAAVLIGISTLKVQDLDTQKRDLEGKIEGLKYLDEIFQDNEKAKAQFKSAKDMAVATMNGNEVLTETIESLEAMSPKGMKLMSLTSDGSVLSFNVIAPRKTTAADLLLQLQKIPTLANSTIPSVVESTDEIGQKTAAFSVSSILVPPVEDEEKEEGEE